MRRAKAKSGARSTPEIKVTRNSPRPQIKASRGPGGPAKKRKVATPDRRGAAAGGPKGGPARSATSRTRVSGSRGGSHRGSGGGGSVHAVSSGGGAAAGAVRVAREIARPVTAVTRPVLRVVGGGLEAIPRTADRATPVARGRAMILIAGVLAAGLIYVNVGRLEAGDGYARYTERSIELQRENTALRSRIANLGAAERIKRYAQKQGLVMPAPEQFDYLKRRRSDAGRAARGYSAPTSPARPGEAGGSAATGGAGVSAATGGAGL